MQPPQLDSRLKPQVFFHGEDRAVPFLGNGMPMVRNDDAHQPEEFWRGFIGVFDLGKPDDLTKYNEVVNAIAKGSSILCREEVEFFEGRYIVFCRWAERYYATPKQVYEGAYRNGQGQLCFST